MGRTWVNSKLQASLGMVSANTPTKYTQKIKTAYQKPPGRLRKEASWLQWAASFYTTQL